MIKWGLTNFEPLETYRGHTEGFRYSLAGSPPLSAFDFLSAVYGIIGVDSFLISASRDSTVRIWNEALPASDCFVLRGHSSAVLCMTLVGQYLYTGSDDCLIKK